MCTRGMQAVPTALSYILLIVTTPGYPNYSPTESAVEGSWEKPRAPTYALSVIEQKGKTIQDCRAHLNKIVSPTKALAFAAATLTRPAFWLQCPRTTSRAALSE